MDSGKQTNNTISIQNVPRLYSLSTKLLFSILIWVICTIIFTGYTLALLWQLESGGIAINNAGSLRMRVYHMVTLLNQRNNIKPIQQEVNNFTVILNNLKQVDQKSLLLPENIIIHQQINRIESSWQNDILPVINRLQKQKQTVSSEQLSFFSDFVENINILVKSIETKNTQHITWLRIIQTIFFIMILLSAFTAIYLLYQLVIKPLTILQGAIQSLSQGQFTSRINTIGKDEFSVVSLGFNKMADNLQDFYFNLEQKVNEKTAALEEKNNELSALYNITAFLHESNTKEIMTEKFLAYTLTISCANAGSIRLLDKKDHRLNYIASQGLPESFIESSRCVSLNCYCGNAIKETNPQTITREISTTPLIDQHDTPSPCSKSNFKRLIIFHIRHNSRELGIITLYFDNDQNTAHAQSPRIKKLIETLAKQLAIALENQQLMQSDKQLAVMQERNLIAQGLHDSIAQSLSFLNMQTQILQKALTNNDTENIEKTIDFIQRGVQESYDDVRELLLNFRTRISENNFNEVVHSLLERFKQQVTSTIHIDITGNGPTLNPQQQLQVIFILQEALSNVRKHAKCSHVNIQIHNHEQFLMTINDNGCGFSKQTIEKKKNHHVGLSIMQERASQISGEIEIASAPNQGTTIIFILPKEQRGIL